MIYVSPNHKFGLEEELLIKIQIDNALDFGWDTKDIILATNFEYEFKGVRSVVVPDNNYCHFRPLSTKSVTVSYLLANEMVEPDQVYWVHDLDAYQADNIEMSLDNCVAAFSDYGWQRKWSLGSYFFNHKANLLLGQLKETICHNRQEDERALIYLTDRNVGNINSLYKKINVTYNFGMRKIAYTYSIAEKPLRVLHFHPFKRGTEQLRKFMYGENDLNQVLMPENLIKIFNNYGIK